MKALLTLLVVMVLAVLALEYWQYRETQAYRGNLDAQLQDLNRRVTALDSKMAQADRELEALSKNSFRGLLDNANEALIQGWSAMIEAVERELEQAREQVEAPDKHSTSPAAPGKSDGAGVL